ncbi:MAG TPA: hypothetical protein VFV38_35960 [Ktedonobacteraceae bacterium]|nr:hypothetical protein [Ktedonobacteraceae bacterium]
MMKTLINVVPCIEVASQHALEGFPKQLFDHFSGTGVMILVISHSWGTHTPERSIEAIFSPSRFISLHRRTRTDRGLEIVEQGLGMRTDAVEYLHDFSSAHLHSMQAEQ